MAAVAFVLPLAAFANSAPRAKPFGWRVEHDEWTGDSFRVRLPDGWLETFRFYFVDTTESRSRGKRSDEQAAYFGITRKQAIEPDKQAKTFTTQALAQPFMIYCKIRFVEKAGIAKRGTATKYSRALERRGSWFRLRKAPNWSSLTVVSGVCSRTSACQQVHDQH
jgi:hypothetical protein